MSFSCGLGGYPLFDIHDIISYRTYHADEFAYYPYKICMSVFGTYLEQFNLHSEECGYNKAFVVWFAIQILLTRYIYY